MNNQFGSFEDIVEKGQGAVQSAKKTTAQGAKNFAQTATQQVSSKQYTPQDQAANESASTTQQQMSDDQAKQFLQDLYGVKNKSQNQQGSQNSSAVISQKPQTPSSPRNVKTALGLADASASQKKVPTPTETIKTALGIPELSSEKVPGQISQSTVKTALGLTGSSNDKTPEELAKIEALRKQLHENYYQNLVNPQKAPDESVTEKLEREDQEQKMAELETDKKKPPKLPANVKQGTGESVVGVSG